MVKPNVYSSTPERVANTRSATPIVFEIAIVLIAIAAHVACIANLPMGFYVDESSVGYNAWSIATTGHDEHGIAWPLYFRAFGEFKNPVYIYFVALLYKLLGFSMWTTRIASAICWLTGSALLYLLGRRLSRDPAIRIYLLLCLGFTPWLFSLSRISFEVICVFPLLAAYLLAIYRAYEEDSPRWTVLAGIVVGVGAYSYSTFRLLAPLHVFIVLVCYWRPQYWRRHAALIFTFALTLLPLAIYVLNQVANLLGRFETLTYIHDPALSLWGKFGVFMGRYLEYFSPSFLALHGDPILRHHTGFGGELLLATVLLSIVGLIAAAFEHNRFLRFLIAGLLISPIAASLTVDHEHSLRAFSLGIFAIVISVVGARRLRDKISVWLMAPLLLATAIQAGFYTWDYYVRYPAESALAFQNYGFKQTLEQASAMAPDRIVVSKLDNQPYIDVLFFGLLVPATKNVSIVVGTEDDVGPRDLFISRDPSLTPDHADAQQPRSLYVVRCYADLHLLPKVD
jgi:4-amino-4-deoxy-L-arabinose transferase-like glycosyltransferase